MKIRLLGPKDIVEAWARELEKSYGIVCQAYPSRGGANEARIYADLDDRVAAEIVGLHSAPTPIPGTAVSLRRVRNP